uniref:Ubiquitin-like domain-containing protein n=1 Tax=Aegilops tauschii TaxID=37682 RepID=R7WBQ8_AEGTA
MVKIPSPRRLFRSRSRSTAGGIGGVDMCAMVAEHERIEWEVRPGGMLVQKRRGPDDDAVVEAILVKVCTAGGAWQHDVSIDATATFGDLQDKDKVLLLEDPAVTERKLRSTTLAQLMGVPCHSFIQV